MRTLKKYPNRRLYDTFLSCYVTMDDVRHLVLSQERFRIIDSKSGEELTRSILLQIILEQENQVGEHILTNNVLQHLVRFHHSSKQKYIAHFLEQSISFFLNQKAQINSAIDTTPVDMTQKMTERKN
ncbi:polyhydroxyalkanoate synthesis repressor PhaR [Litorivicinus sp.]|jgi:polyhydroxyalkanoate synthesis repressor PhaR|nr:polyhydroxyalkanoate synthesis repressor PhaR [Litorivicinus sp.]MDB9863340.1 polyhydroxyalkanoate synthesis repressor PhaR [Litorivicinus sp.]MDC1208400.1 polyhydroxyalkanoate synthesis repressor PhaR [Litorivicinus sp.]